MTSAARLARLEASLSPRQATLLWLAEAQRFGSLAAYATSLLERPASMLPLVAVPQQARRAVRAALRGQPRSAVAEREQETFHEALFLVQLAIELERAAQATQRRAELRWLVLWSEWRAPQVAGAVDEPSTTGRTAAADLGVGLAAAQEARALLERRYLDGRSALFPDTLAAWQELQGAVQLLVAGGRQSRGSSALVKREVGGQAGSITETTRAACLAMLGEARQGAIPGI